MYDPVQLRRDSEREDWQRRVREISGRVTPLKRCETKLIQGQIYIKDIYGRWARQ